MKKLVLFALSVVATAAMAAGPAGVQVEINGSSTQTADLRSSTVRNTASGVNSQAQQNISSNAGDVFVAGGATSRQTTNARASSSITNTSNANTEAQQNMSSNSGDVTIRGTSIQLTTLVSSAVSNTATGSRAKAVQSIASNASCSTCL